MNGNGCETSGHGPQRNFADAQRNFTLTGAAKLRLSATGSEITPAPQIPICRAQRLINRKVQLRYKAKPAPPVRRWGSR